MKKEEYQTTLNAPKEKVWEVLWGTDTYPQWTAPFSEGSRAETDWKEGSKVLFLNGKGEGMVSKIHKKIPTEFMSIKHLGFVKDSIEDTTGEEVQKWTGAMENYELEEKDGKTILTVKMDMDEGHADYFREVWPKAFGKLKELSEETRINSN